MNETFNKRVNNKETAIIHYIDTYYNFGRNPYRLMIGIFVYLKTKLEPESKQEVKTLIGSNPTSNIILSFTIKTKDQ